MFNLDFSVHALWGEPRVGPLYSHYMTDRQERFDLKISKLKILWKQRHLHLRCPWGKLKHIKKLISKWTIPLRHSTTKQPTMFRHLCWKAWNNNSSSCMNKYINYFKLMPKNINNNNDNNAFACTIAYQKSTKISLNRVVSNSMLFQWARRLVQVI